MKTLMAIMIVIFLSMSNYSSAYSKTIPAEVTESFNKKFPKATNLKWKKENKHNYEASFKIDDEKHSADFSEKGEWKETETTISFDKLPQKVQAAFNTNMKAHKVKAASIIETSNGKTEYEIEYLSRKKTVEIFYDENGNKIKE